MKNILLLIVFLQFISTTQGQTNLSSIKIGSQIWMIKNLDVTKYRNGDPIPEVKDSATWATLTKGAYCYYNNDPANGVIYGKLYNWYAVNDPRGLAPKGWHVPSDTEWTTLTDFLGGEKLAGGTMKEIGTMHWIGPNDGATNSTGFTALPGGGRGRNGWFFDIGTYGHWWSSTKSNKTFAWERFLTNDYSAFNRIDYDKGFGYSLRCIKD